MKIADHLDKGTRKRFINQGKRGVVGASDIIEKCKKASTCR